MESVENKAKVYQAGMTRDEAKKRLFGILDSSGNLLLENTDSGEIVRLGKKAIRKMVSDPAVQKSVSNGFTRGQHYAVAANIADLFRDSLRVYSHSDRDGNQNVEIHRYATPLQTGEDMAYITVKESHQHGKRVYSVERIEIGKLVGILKEALEQGSPAHFPSTRVFHTDNITKLKSKIKKK